MPGQEPNLLCQPEVLSLKTKGPLSCLLFSMLGTQPASLLHARQRVIEMTSSFSFSFKKQRFKDNLGFHFFPKKV